MRESTKGYSHECSDNIVRLFDGVEDQVYTVDRDNTWMTLKPRFAIAAENCPVVCKLYENGSKYSSRRSAVPGIEFVEYTGEVSFRTTDKRLDGRTVNFKTLCTASENEEFGSFSDEFAITFKVPEECDAQLAPPTYSDIKRMWGQAPETRVLPKFSF
jgi:hypothetical protein